MVNPFEDCVIHTCFGTPGFHRDYNMWQDALLLLALRQFALWLATGLLDVRDKISAFVKDRQVHSLAQNVLKAVSARALGKMHIIINLLYIQ